jgi:hypothetical protein
VAQPTAPHDPKFLPLILPDAGEAGMLRPFFHYRRIGIAGRCPSQLFVYPSTDPDRRAGSFWLVAELFAALTSRNDPWVRERTRLLFDGAFNYVVATLGLERVRLADIGCGSARISIALCRAASAKYGTTFDLTLVDVVRTAKSIRTAFFRNLQAFGNLSFRHENFPDWIAKAVANGGCFDVAMMLRVCDVFNRFTIEALPRATVRAMLHGAGYRSTLSADVADPAKLIEAGSIYKIHHRLARSRHGDGTLLRQFSLSDYFKGIRQLWKVRRAARMKP